MALNLWGRLAREAQTKVCATGAESTAYMPPAGSGNPPGANHLNV